MRFVLLLFPMIACAQEVRPGESQERRGGRELLLAIYRLENVARACMEHPEGYVTVKIDGKEFSVNCRVRAAYLEFIGETP